MTDTPAKITPTQADRDAAADIWRDYVAKVGECMVENGLRAGQQDESLIVQSYARHAEAARQEERTRLAHEINGLKDALAQAEGIIAELEDQTDD